MSMNEELDDEIDLLELFFTLLKRWQLIVLTVFVCASLSFFYFYKTTDRLYKASIKMYVNADTVNIGSSITISDLNASNSLVPIYAEILDTHLVLDKVGQKLTSYGYSGYDYYVFKNDDMISSSAIKNTPVFEVSVTDVDPKRSITIANTIAEVLPDEIAAIIDGSSARIVDRAQSAEPLSRGVAKKTMIAALIGFVISCAYVVIVDFFLNDSIKDTEWLVQTFNDIPILGKVPDASIVNKNNNHYYYRQKKFENKEGNK